MGLILAGLLFDPVESNAIKDYGDLAFGFCKGLKNQNLPMKYKIIIPIYPFCPFLSQHKSERRFETRWAFCIHLQSFILQDDFPWRSCWIWGMKQYYQRDFDNNPPNSMFLFYISTWSKKRLFSLWANGLPWSIQISLVWAGLPLGLWRLLEVSSELPKLTIIILLGNLENSSQSSMKFGTNCGFRTGSFCKVRSSILVILPP